MAILKTNHVKCYNEHDRTEFIEFKYKVSVNKEGLFTTTIDEAVVRLFKNANISLTSNARGRDGFFSGKTLKELENQIGEICSEYFSRELTEEKIVIKYSIGTTCTYCFNEKGEIVPNGNYVKNQEGNYRKGGTKQLHANTNETYGLSVYVKPFYKRKYKYRSGIEKTEYVNMRSNGRGQGLEDNNLKWLTNIVGIGTSNTKGPVSEIEYTEPVAKFFVDLIKSLCMMNEKIKDFISPEKIQELVNTQKALL